MSVARIADMKEAVRQGRCAYAEGVPGNLNPYQDGPLRRAWQTGWWLEFQRTPPPKASRAS